MNEQLTRFEAPTLDEALEKIRSVFGDDGMIVGTRNFRRGGVLGLGGHKMVEVFVADTRSRIENIQREKRERETAPAAGSRVEERPRLEGQPGLAERSDRPSALPPAGERRARAAPGLFGEPALPPGEEPEIGQLSESLTQLRDGIRDLLERTKSSGEFAEPFLKECFDLLLACEVDSRVAESLVREIGRLRVPPGYPTPARVEAVVRGQLAKLFRDNPPVETSEGPRVICLVGPTGVGKTTTIAKLAARARIHEGRSVGLITLDTFRIAAVDQLQRYADIIDIPLQVASDPEELAEALDLAREDGQDLVFIDSAGRSQRDELKMAEIEEFLAVLPHAEVHLVLSCTTHARTMDSVADRFVTTGFDRLILTKSDESVSLGSLVAALVRIGQPVAYVTDGQNVPDDIMPGDPERLADLVLRNRRA